jgi:hypothetical protein
LVISALSIVILHSGERWGTGMSATDVVAFEAVEAVAIPVAQADSDETMIALWLNGRSRHTIRAYEADVRRSSPIPANRSAALPLATYRLTALASPDCPRPASLAACHP